MELKKGDRVWLTDVGHKGFFYPNLNSETLLFDISFEPRCWVGGGDKRPGIIPENAILATGSSDKHIVVWVKR